VPGPSAALFSAPFYSCVNNFYVATTGSDSNAGTQTSPWRTIQHANDAGRAAGDCVNVEPGTYTSGVNVTHGGNAATPSGYVVYRCTQLDACKITDMNKGFSVISSGGVGPNYLMFDGFELAALSETAYGLGIAAEDGQNPENTLSVHHIWATNNIIHGYGQGGIGMNDGEYFYVIHNATYNNANVTCDAQGSGIGFVVLKAFSGYSRTAMDNSFGSFSNIIEFNISYNNILTSCGSASNPYDTDGNGIILDTFDGSGTTFGPYAGGGTLVASNVSYQNGAKGIEVFRNSSATVVVANNTVYDNNLDPYNSGTARGEIDLNGTINTMVVNNIIYPVPASSASDPRCHGVSYSGDAPASCPLQANAAILSGSYTGAGGTDISVTNSGNVFSHNVTYGGTPLYGWGPMGNAVLSPDTMNCAGGASPNQCNVNPLLNSATSFDFTLESASPAIGYALPESYLPASIKDAGAYQSGGN
jgi:hypothetical protein